MKGSTWHKWDLHYHTPSSYDYKNKGKSNQEIVNELLADNVSAVAVTDHHKIDFKRIKELNKLAAGEIKFFRGIEINSELGGNESVHFIAIFPDNLEEYEIRNKFLAPLNITEEETSRDEKKYHQAISYAEFLQKANELEAIITVHAGKKSNSIENIANWCTSKKNFKEVLLSKVHILETNNKKDIEETYKKTVFKALGREWPIVVCSDYHGEYGYREYLNNATTPATIAKRDATWIKADLTFEGLKQIIFEPNLRVKVQEQNPTKDKLGLKLESLQIQNSKLFNSTKIDFNSDMIAIIGEKGAGKTALLDIIAHTLGNKKKQNSFIYRAGDKLKDSKIVYNFLGDTLKEISFDIDIGAQRCRYINPVELSQFCEDENKMQDFLKSIIINEEIGKANKSIVERNFKLESNILEISKLDGELQKQYGLLQSIKDLEDKKILAEKNKPSLPTVNKERENYFSQLRNNIQKYRQELDEINSQYNALVSFDTNKDELLSTEIEEVQKKLHIKIADSINIKDFQIIATYHKDTIEILEKRQQELYNKKLRLEKQYSEVSKKYKEVQAEIFKNQELQSQYDKWQTYIDDLNKDLKKLQIQAEKLKECSNKRTVLFEQCIELYKDNIISKQQIFKYYKDLKSELSEQIGDINQNKITFEPILNINKDALYVQIKKVISLKAVNEETLKQNIKEKYQVQYEKLLKNIDEILIEDVKLLLGYIFNIDSEENLYAKKLNDKSFKNTYTLIDLYKVAFLDYADIDYAIQFNEIPMEQLSSGQKGIVLLKLLLKLDKSIDPLLIDQPEDNLDNKSIYDQLVEEFKNIKQKRQLIIATHNPNLVINTDVEQVIIAKYKKKEENGYIAYKSGSIEDRDIREEICQILEGGQEAFRNREKRYNI